MRQRGKRLLVKRAVDVAVAGSALVAAAPLLAVTAGAVAATIGRPVIFRQTRIGRNDERFEMFKFRTMREATDAEGKPLPDAERLTRLGDFLRRRSIDELPQLVNVLRGEMSLVGPRPLVVPYLERYSAEQRRRHEVLPGLTGWGQINGRNTLSWRQKFEYDVWYVDHWSLRLDAKILAKTVLAVARGDGVSADGHVTMPEFTGTEEDP